MVSWGNCVFLGRCWKHSRSGLPGCQACQRRERNLEDSILCPDTRPLIPELLLEKGTDSNNLTPKLSRTKLVGIGNVDSTLSQVWHLSVHNCRYALVFYPTSLLAHNYSFCCYSQAPVHQPFKLTIPLNAQTLKSINLTPSL